MKTVEEDNIWPDFVPSGNFTPWEHVQLARAKTRPTGKDYIEALFDDFTWNFTETVTAGMIRQ